MARYKYGKLVVDLTDMQDGDTITNKSLLEWLESIASIPISNAIARRNAFKNLKDLVLIVSISNCIIKIPMILLADDVSMIEGNYLQYNTNYMCNIDLESKQIGLSLVTLEQSA